MSLHARFHEGPPRSRLGRSVRAVVGIASTLVGVGLVQGGGSGCVSVPEDALAPVLATHVKDWRDEVIYQIIVDRFDDGDVNNDYFVQPGDLNRYQGGDWQGIIDHLDYFQALGVTTLWISPIVKNVFTDAGVDGYHGYWSQDLYSLNPNMGDLATLRTMVAMAHDLNIKVVLDIVCNHMGQIFFYDENLNGQPDDYIEGSGGYEDPVVQINEYDPPWNPIGVQALASNGPAGPGTGFPDPGRAPILFLDDPTTNHMRPTGLLGTLGAYHGMGHILNFNDEDQTLRGDFTGGLKDIATELPSVREELTKDYVNWVTQVDFDGFRVDTVKDVDHGFWQYFIPHSRQELAAQNKRNFIVFGEVFSGDDVLDGSYTVPNEFDSVFYFSQHYTVYRNVFEYAHDPKTAQGTTQIQQLWEEKTTNYGTTPQPGGIGLPPYKALINFIDNHDVNRFLFDSGGDVAALRNALTLNMTAEGIPCLYYGTEQDFDGGNDPANREVLWTTGFPTTGTTFTHFSHLADLRRTYSALRYGDTTVRWSTNDIGSEDDAGIFAFERTGGDAGAAYALVVLNTNDFKTSSTSNDGHTMPVLAQPGEVLVDVLNPGSTTYTVGTDGTMNLAVPAQSAVVLVPKSQLGGGT
jgi:alpha-amylase